MNEQSTKAKDSEILQILITEHTNLQAARSTTVFEANGRTTLFLGAVSSVLLPLPLLVKCLRWAKLFSSLPSSYSLRSYSLAWRPLSG